MPRSSARLIAAIDSPSSWEPQPNCQPPPPTAQLPKPRGVMDSSVVPNCLVRIFLNLNSHGPVRFHTQGKSTRCAATQATSELITSQLTVDFQKEKTICSKGMTRSVCDHKLPTVKIWTLRCSGCCSRRLSN